MKSTNSRQIKLEKLIRKKLWLAPLAGYTDKAFRTICKECGADVVVSEMVSADGLIYNNDKTMKYARFNEDQRPFGIQLFGSDAEIMRKGTELILSSKPDFIDINMGCPVKKVVKRGAGSALMKTPEIAEKIVQEIKNVLGGTEILLSVKIRAGWDKFSINATEFGQRMENAGADMICLHPRTKAQMFSGKSDWSLITELKSNLKIPIVGNGDIDDIESAEKMFSETGCDAVMIGRGILGKPWLFNQIKEFQKTSIKTEPEVKEKLAIIKRHFDLLQHEKGYGRAIKEMRSHLAFYTKGYREGAKVRNFINRCFDFEDIYQAIVQLYQNQ
ncbi:MAG: tRNA dihydrouridine synthase DusB [Candidatus Cloacimonetes bacterium]|nr:tRNA dihydrouridine synthase DusB [Candidatus Cloacimonadota bacterium]MCF7814476.1 tRNA dihydrouridine synthase DusB [Candidatus Cloacimonadota bacterium]MCF7867868.1 tRNA dihydrouridine synthase DusB [Candidatus Cloacimonadota bacterium]MCF7883687.1 tRNA dihydrouridine synthase DusB [Candidatus Cloacimonadota bacterium]